LQHAWITWVTRGLYVGFRRIYLGTQVDDMFLETPMYRPQGQNYRCKPEDLDLHVTYQANLNELVLVKDTGSSLRLPVLLDTPKSVVGKTSSRTMRMPKVDW
jgi:hypothetical protein